MDYVNLINLYQLTTGRRLFALQKVRAEAVSRGQTALVERIDAAIVHDLATRRLELEWSGARLQTVSDAVTGVDRLLDSALFGLRDMAQAATRGAREDDPVHAQAVDFLAAIFPAGVIAVTSLPYVEQLTAVEAIVDMLQGELAPLVAGLGLQTHVARVADLTAEYRAVQEDDSDRIDFDVVKAARSVGRGFVCEVIALILGTFHRLDDADHGEARSALLRPIMAQNEAVREYRARHGRVVDVDPDTGEPESSDGDSGPDGPEPPAVGSPAAAS